MIKEQIPNLDLLALRIRKSKAKLFLPGLPSYFVFNFFDGYIPPGNKYYFIMDTQTEKSVAVCENDHNQIKQALERLYFNKTIMDLL